PRTTGLTPTKRHPSTICRNTDGVDTCRVWFFGNSRSVAISPADTRYARELTQSATCEAPTGLPERAAEIVSTTPETTANSAAATGAVPYVTRRLSWFASSSRSLGTMLGTVASLAGTQNRLAHSISSVATISHW